MKDQAIKRAKDLLAGMSFEEKLFQLSCQMLFDVDSDYKEKRDFRHGNYRNPGHFLHAGRSKLASPSEVTECINNDLRQCIEAQPHSIPPIEHGEALHSGLWGASTSFPQPIGMAATFDDEMVEKIAEVIGKECAVVGVRQVLSPVVNIARDCRWGRTMETFGEDVLLSSKMGAAFCRGLQNNGVIATPKHFVDNYSHGGRDSNASDNSERALREVYLKPFEACVKEGGAMSIMPSYNSWDGVACSCNDRLLNDILRDEWGFDGFLVSDYGGVDTVCYAHRLVDTLWKAQALCLKAGLDICFTEPSFNDLKKAYDEGWITEEDIDRAVLRVLTAKIRIGIMDSPFGDPEAAEKLVRCDEHKKLALEAARRSIVLLKNEGILPLDSKKIKKLAVFGEGAKLLPLGKNYSSPYNSQWDAEDAKTPLQFLKEYLEGVEVIFAEDEKIEELATSCDAAIYFTTSIEGEGLDRSDIRLPGVMKTAQKDESAVIVGKFETSVKNDQEDGVRRMLKANKNSVVVLLNGSPIDMSGWIDDCSAVLEAWFPGEQGAQAISEILFGETNPGGKLPITIPKSVGQLPLFYSHKPSGRGYGYIENDGSPRYPFGFGLSYTDFKLDNFKYKAEGNELKISLDIENVGNYDGSEVVQVYISGRNCEVAMPLLELKAYKRITLNKGEKQNVSFILSKDAFCYYDRKMNYGMHNGDYEISLGTSSEDLQKLCIAFAREGKLVI